MGLFDKIIGVVTDSVKVLAEPAVSSYNSITGKGKKINYSTGAGKAVGGSVQVGTDALHKGLKTYADKITGDNATKLADMFRSDQYKEAGGNYYENRATQTGALGKFEVGTKTFMTLAGSAYGDKVLQDQQKKQTSGGPQRPTEGGIPPAAPPIGNNLITDRLNLKGAQTDVKGQPLSYDSYGKTSGNMNLTDILNSAGSVLSALNVGQGKVNSNGNMSVPTSQSGSGLFTGLVNIAANLIPKKNSQGVSNSPVVQTNVATSTGGGKPILSGGGVSISFPPLDSRPVTENTTMTSNSGSGNSTTVIAWIVGGFVFVFFVLPRLMKTFKLK